MPPAAVPTAWEVMPDSPAGSGHSAESAESADTLQRTALLCRQKVARRAVFAAGVALVPVPGLDWVTDIGLLMKLLPEINAAFGLSPGQIERLAPDRRVVVYKAISASGGLLVGKLITRELVIRVVSLVGVRLSTQQAAKFVPIAGQAVSAVLTYTALRYVCEQHIQQCLAVARQLQLPAPGAPAGTEAG